MSYIIDTDVTPFCHGQNHSGGVPVSTVGVAAVYAPEVSLVQFELLGSRETPTARHGRIRIGSGRCGGHTPVDANTASTTRIGLDFSAHDERGIPVSEAVAIDANRRRRRRQISRPHHRDRDALRQHQVPITDREPTRRVLQRRQGSLARLHLRATVLGHLERVVQRLGIIAKHLLLSDLRPLTQPPQSRARSGEQLPEPRERRFLPGFLLVHRLIPQPPAAAPLSQQRRLGGAPGPQPVGGPHHLIHSNILSKRLSCDQSDTPTSSSPPRITESPGWSPDD